MSEIRDTEALRPKNQIEAAAFIDRLNKENSEAAWMRFYSETSVQIDGDMSLDELESLVGLMKSFTK